MNEHKPGTKLDDDSGQLKRDVKKALEKVRKKYRGQFRNEIWEDHDDHKGMPYLYTEIHRDHRKNIIVDERGVVEYDKKTSGTKISAIAPQDAVSFFDFLGDTERANEEYAKLLNFSESDVPKRTTFLNRIEGGLDSIDPRDIEKASSFLISLARIPFTGKLHILDSGYHRKRDLKGGKADWTEKEQWADGQIKDFMSEIYTKLRERCRKELGKRFPDAPKEAINADVTVRYSKSVNERTMVDTDGFDAEERQPRTWLSVTAVVKVDNVFDGDGNQVVGEMRETFGGMGGEECMRGAAGCIERLAAYAADDMTAIVPSKALPKKPVLFTEDAEGFFIHECIGHTLEADLVKGHSSFVNGMKGEKILPSSLTITSEPDIEGSHGSIHFDNQGVKSRKVELVKNGVLVETLGTLEADTELKLEKTGHGRAESYEWEAIPRMTNLVLKPGKDKRSLDKVLGSFTGYVVRGASYGYTEGRNSVIFPMRVEYWNKGTMKNVLKGVKLDIFFDSLDEVKVLGEKTVNRAPGYCGKDWQIVPVEEISPVVIVGKGAYLQKIECDEDGKSITAKKNVIMDVAMRDRLNGPAEKTAVEYSKGKRLYLMNPRAYKVAEMTMMSF